MFDIKTNCTEHDEKNIIMLSEILYWEKSLDTGH